MKKNKIIIILLIIISTIVIGSIGIQKYSNKDEVSKNSLISFIVDGQYQEKMPDMSTHYFNGYECNDSSVLLWNSKTSKLEARKFTVNSRCNAKFISKEKQSDEVIYTLVNGDYIESRKQKKDASVILPTPTKDGYEFDGWYYEDGTKVPDNVTAEDLDGKKIIAKWKAATYTITFDANDGSGSQSTKKVTHGETYGDLPAPTRNGYKFVGWFTATNGGEQKFSTTKVDIIKDETLYAHWEANEYKITLNAQGGSITEGSSTIQIKYNATVSLPEATKDGYTFGGWYTEAVDGSIVSNPYTLTNAKDITLYAHWTKEGGENIDPTSDIISTASLNVGDTVNYSVEGDLGVISEWVVIKKGDKPELVAKTVSPGTYELGSNDCGVTEEDNFMRAPFLLNEKAESYLKDASIVEKVRHMGFKENQKTCVKASECSDDAEYEDDVILVKAAMNNSISTGSVYWLPSRFNYWGSRSIKVVDTNGEIDPTKYTNINNVCKSYSYAIRPIITLEQDIKFKKMGENYELVLHAITFNANGGTFEPGENGKITVYAGESLLSFPSEPTREGFKFDGWYTEVSGGTRVETLENVTSDQMLYAHWKQIHTVTFDANGGTLTGSKTMEVYAGESLTSLPSDPTREGFKFDGWYKSANSDNIADKITLDSIFNNSVTVYAHWSQQQYTITFNSNGGTAIQSITVDYGGTAILTAPTREGYEFDGWYTELNGGNYVPLPRLSNVTSDQTLYARWKKTYTKDIYASNDDYSTVAGFWQGEYSCSCNTGIAEMKICRFFGTYDASGDSGYGDKYSYRCKKDATEILDGCIGDRLTNEQLENEEGFLLNDCNSDIPSTYTPGDGIEYQVKANYGGLPKTESCTCP